MSAILAWRSLITPLVLALGMVFGVNYLSIGGSTKVELNPAVERQDVYVIGNSMFGTALDLRQLRDALPGEDVDFAYYNGHYTSMWYLAATVGMDAGNAPETIVWGFRPTYAILPAFRQNKETDENRFAVEAPQAYWDVLAAAGDPTAQDDAPADTAAKGVNDQVNFSGRASAEPFERFGALASDTIKRPFDALNGATDVKSLLVDRSASMLERVGFSMGIEALDPASARRPSDRLIAYATNGRVQRADALVIDNGEQFVNGERMIFGDSFIPRTSEVFERLGVRQIVVIFRPVRMYSEPMAADADAFYRDALTYFEARDIEVIDLIADPGLELRFFAKGDHYNQEGAEYVTRRIAETVVSGR